MGVALTATRLELGLGGSMINILRELGANAIITPSDVNSTESQNRATGRVEVVTGWVSGSPQYLEITLDNYEATYVGAPTQGARGPLPEGRMASVFDGATQYMTASSYISAFGALITSGSPLAGRTAPFTLVVLFKGGNAGEPLLGRSNVSGAAYSLFTDAFACGGVGDRASAGVTFPDTSDANDWVLLVIRHSHGSFTAGASTQAWKNGVPLTLTGSTSVNQLCSAASGTLYIGRDVAGTDFFTGTIALAAFIPGDVDQADVDRLEASRHWADVSSDLAGWEGLEWEYGLPGAMPDDLIARTGDCLCTLKNAINNSGGVLGYYSPGHSNCRSGFGPGIPARLSLDYSGVTYYKFRGRIDSIRPTAGRAGTQGARLTFVDWMEEPAISPLPRLATETQTRADEAIAMITNRMASPPAGADFDQGRDTFPYVFDSASSSNSPAMGELDRLVRSERGFLYVIGDTLGGGTLRFENRHTRALSPDFAATLDNSMYELDAGRSRRDIITSVTVTIHPRRIDASATTVLYELADLAAPRIGPNETIQWRAGYRDPNSPIAKIGGSNIVTPVAITDYVMNSAEDGSGDDVTDDMTVTFQHAGVYGIFTITNTTSSDVYVTTLQIRGKGIYQYADLLCNSVDPVGLIKYGENHASIDMAYQTDPQVGQGVADWVRALWGLEATGVARLSFLANRSEALMLAALAVEPGQRVGVVEDVTGLVDVVDGANVGYFVHRVRYSLSPGGMLRVTWTLAPADREKFWILDEVGSSELDETTRLAYA